MVIVIFFVFDKSFDCHKFILNIERIFFAIRPFCKKFVNELPHFCFVQIENFFGRCEIIQKLIYRIFLCSSLLCIVILEKFRRDYVIKMVSIFNN